MDIKKLIKNMNLHQKAKLLNKIISWYKLEHEDQVNKMIEEIK